MRTQTNPIYTAVYLTSVFFPAVATIFKETIFDEAKQKLGRPLDIFVVNSFSSAAQAVSVFLFLPLLSALRGIPPSQLPDYLMQGAHMQADWLNFAAVRPEVASSHARVAACACLRPPARSHRCLRSHRFIITYAHDIHMHACARVHYHVCT